MFSKFVGSFRSKGSPTKDVKNDKGDNGNLPERHVYCRPKFLGLTSEEETVCGDHELRMVFTPKDDSLPKLPCRAGYAECINGGKSIRNEDQATAGKFVLPSQPTDLIKKGNPIDVRYFCIFDGHAGPGAALMAADQLINHLQEKLMNIVEYLFDVSEDTGESGSDSNGFYDVTVDSLIKGAIEAAFISFDEHISTESKSFKIEGGCTAIMALFLLNRLFVAHAGDCRAVGFIGETTVQLSREFTPETDAERIQYLAKMNPDLMRGVFNENCYHKPLGRRDIGTKNLYRPPLSSGWYCKTVTQEDVDHPPLVAGRGKWARLMGVIGVTRGFGDHTLTVPATDVSVKAFMTPMPEIRVVNFADQTFEDEDVIVMGSDGLWDFVSNEQMEATVRNSLKRCKEQNDVETICYSDVAKDAVHSARGDNTGRGWKMADGRDASFDDISAFVIPLLHLNYRERKSSHKQMPEG